MHLIRVSRVHGDLRAFLPRSHGDYVLSRSDFSEISRGSLCSHTVQKTFGVVLASSGYLLTWWWTRNTVMKTTWSWWGRHEIGVVLRTPWNCLCKCNHFRGVFATRVLRVYYVYGDVTTLGSRPSRPHRVLTAFQVRSPDLGICFEHVQNKRRDSAIIGDHGDHSTMSGVSTTFLPRLHHAYGDLGALWTHFPSP